MQKPEFHKKYRELLEQNALDAPDDVWNNIASDLDKDQQELSLDESELSLIDEVWNTLEDELDIDEVWNNIDAELEEKKKVPVYLKYRRWLAAAIILLLIGLSSIMHYYSADLTQPLTANKHQYNEHGIDAIDEKSPLYEEPVSGKSGSNVTIVLSVSDDSLSFAADTKKYTTTQLTVEPDAVEVMALNPDLENSPVTRTPILVSGSFSLPEIYEPLESKTAYVELPEAIDLDEVAHKSQFNFPNTHWIASFAPEYDGDSSDKLPFDRKDSKWTTGVVAAVKNTYLLNQETMNGFSPTGMNSANLTFQPDIGVNVQYALSQKYILESNVFLSSSTKQNYNFYSYGEYVSKEMQLKYMASEVLLKQNSKRSYLKDKLIRRNVAGVYVAHMRSATEAVGSDLHDVSSKYAALDYGVMLGQEFELRSKGPVKVTTGITLKYGLPNVYQGDADVPGNFNKTHNASLEFRVGIAYRWKAKVGIDHYLGSLIK